MIRTKSINFRMREDLKNRLDAYLDRTESATLTSTMEEALQRYLDAVDPIKEPDPAPEPEPLQPKPKIKLKITPPSPSVEPDLAVRNQSTSAKGPEYCNEGRANEERMDEVRQAVAMAVKNLAAEYNWTSLPIRKRIELLKVETLKQRGVAVSTQTLYRDWCKPLWNYH